MTRSEVEKILRPDGGISFGTAQRYYVPKFEIGSRLVMIEAVFQPTDMPDAVFAPAPLAAEWCRVHDLESWKGRKSDKVRFIVRPFLFGGSID